MNTNIKTAAKLAAFAGAFALTGCAFIPDTVHPTYTPPANVTKVPGADKVVVDVVVKNENKHKDEVTVNKDALGIKMAGVYMHVANDFHRSISELLEKEGFTVSKKGNSIVQVNVLHFFLHEEMHFDSITHTGYGSMRVMVKNKNGDVIYNKIIRVKKIYLNKVGGDVFSTGRSKSARIMMTKMVNELFSDKLFTHAILIGSEQQHDGIIIPKINDS